MVYILTIETTSKNCSVAIAKDGVQVALREMAELGYSHAEKLHVFVNEVLQEAGLQLSDLNAVAVSQGPGSYTGLRIGVSAAKGFCLALDIPLIAIDTMEVLARQANVKEGLIVPLIDARRMEVYTAIFDAYSKKVSDTKAEIITVDSFSLLNEQIYFIGDGVAKCKSILVKDSFHFLDSIVFPSAKEMCELSFEKHKKSDYVNVAYFEPYYLKDFFVAPKKG
jgi:tRNA threonylcarbamoyladenosine biosynthesis protein TsaB